MTMTPNNESATSMQSASLSKSMLAGAGVAFVLIALFIFPLETRPDWSAYWKVKPLLVVPIAGAMGGLFYYLMGGMRRAGGWKTAVAYVLCIIVYIVALWLGTVLGLNGTLWD